MVLWASQQAIIIALHGHQKGSSSAGGMYPALAFSLRQLYEAGTSAGHVLYRSLQSIQDLGGREQVLNVVGKSPCIRRNNEHQLGRVHADEDAPFGVSIKPGLVTSLNTKVGSLWSHIATSRCPQMPQRSFYDDYADRGASVAIHLELCALTRSFWNAGDQLCGIWSGEHCSGRWGHTVQLWQEQEGPVGTG